MAVIRWLLGRLILLFDFIFTPRGVKRAAEEQAKIDSHTAKLTLYQYPACPFCVKVRRAMKRESLRVELRDARAGKPFNQELQQGGQIKVPCLRIEKDCGGIEWLYESSEIIKYLQQRFSQTVAA